MQTPDPESPPPVPTSDDAVSATLADDEPLLHATKLSPQQLTQSGLILEIALVAVALVIATFGFYDLANPISSWWSVSAIGHIAIGCLLALPLLFVVLVILPKLAILAEFFRYLDRQLLPLFRKLTFLQVLLISLSAGIGEGLLFRWCLQGGLIQHMPTVWAILLASLVFGLAHFLTFSYFVNATLLGLILGLIYLYVHPLAAIACHAFYDLVALLYAKKAGFLDATTLDTTTHDNGQVT